MTTIFEPTNDATKKSPERGLPGLIFQTCCEYDTKKAVQAGSASIVRSPPEASSAFAPSMGAKIGL
jgi:hypothetical protein